MTTANPSRHQATDSTDPLLAAARDKIAQAVQLRRELENIVEATTEQVKEQDDELAALRLATALHEAEITQRKEELTTARDEAQQELDRLNVALDIKDDEPEPAAPDEPATPAEPVVVDHPVVATAAVKSSEPEPTTKVKPDPPAKTKQDAPTPTRKNFKQRFQDIRSRLA